MLIMLFRMQKETGDVCDPWRLVIMVLTTQFYMQKPQMSAGTPRGLQFWC